MSPQDQEKFIKEMYQVLFAEADADKIPNYCTPDFVEENNYDVLDYDTFVAHVNSLSGNSGEVTFDIDFIVNVPGQVVIRTQVNVDDRISGAPPISLLISYWQFAEDGRVNYCKEVQYDGV